MNQPETTLQPLQSEATIQRDAVIAAVLYDTFHTARLSEHPEDEPAYHNYARNFVKWLNVFGFNVTRECVSPTPDVDAALLREIAKDHYLEDRLERMASRLENNATLVQTLTNVRGAVAKADAGALGWSQLGFGEPDKDVVSIRDEVLTEIDCALAFTNGTQR